MPLPLQCLQLQAPTLSLAAEISFMPLLLQVSSHWMDARVMSAGLDSQRERNSSLDGSMLTTTCRLI